MATDAAPPVNGMYNGHQYGSAAELPASTPGVSHGPSASQSTIASTTATAAKADPQEIGWYFVEQYYTTLSKNPERIHLFYSKKSQLVVGVEAEKVVPAVGVKAISEKMKELDIQDCKVRVLNVDSQASHNNIVVQVIGEMSNKSEPHHRFVQTFVLAEQPNGYFVLNDIFRYLNDDEDEIVEDEAPQEHAVAHEEHASPAAPVADTEKAQDAVAEEAAAEKVDAKLEEVGQAEEETPAPDTNGVAAEPAAEPEAEAEEAPESTKEVFEETSKVADTTPAAATGIEKPLEPEPTRAQTPAKSAEPAPAADVPPVRKTWASMVGTKASPAPAAPIPTATAVPSQPKAQKPSQPAAPQSATSDNTPPVAAQDNEWQMAESGKKQNKPQPKTSPEPNALAYIKNVTEKIGAAELRAELVKYGELKYFDVSRQRNCAFVEFADADGYNAAVAANPHTIGTEQILVEERRPRPNAFGGSNASFTRGGASAGRGRGGMQGRGGSQGGGFPKDAGRGNFQQRGGKSGNVTPKGRGQAQAV